MASRMVTMRMDADLLERLDRAAVARGQSRTELVDRLLWESIESEESAIKALENPLVRGLVSAMVASPALLRLMSVAAGDPHNAGEVDSLIADVNEQMERGRDRSKSKKPTRKGATA